MVYRPDHPVGRTKGPIGLHRVVLYDSTGPGPHPCHWCGKKVDWHIGVRHLGDKLVVDHLDNEPANNTPENLVPSCIRCNTGRVQKPRIRNDEVSIQSGQYRTRAEWRTCNRCGTSFKHPIADRRPSHGRFCSFSCAMTDVGQRKLNSFPIRDCPVCGGPIPPGANKRRQKTCSKSCGGKYATHVKPFQVTSHP